MIYLYKKNLNGWIIISQLSFPLISFPLLPPSKSKQTAYQIEYPSRDNTSDKAGSGNPNASWSTTAKASKIEEAIDQWPRSSLI